MCLSLDWDVHFSSTTKPFSWLVCAPLRPPEGYARSSKNHMCPTSRSSDITSGWRSRTGISSSASIGSQLGTRGTDVVFVRVLKELQQTKHNDRETTHPPQVIDASATSVRPRWPHRECVPNPPSRHSSKIHSSLPLGGSVSRNNMSNTLFRRPTPASLRVCVTMWRPATNRTSNPGSDGGLHGI